jgi:hypothetical protein
MQAAGRTLQLEMSGVPRAEVEQVRVCRQDGLAAWLIDFACPAWGRECPGGFLQVGDTTHPRIKLQIKPFGPPVLSILSVRSPASDGIHWQYM